MQTQGQRIEEMQDRLAELDPNKEQELTEMFEDYVGSVYRQSDKTRTEKQQEADEAELVYAQALMDALRDHRVFV